MSGYSPNPLFKKLGYKSGMRAHLVGDPDHYFKLLVGQPDEIEFVPNPEATSLVPTPFLLALWTSRFAR
ncbi:MAG: hypothetical protein ACI9W4_000294 [Rhodothermales bacterium]|jgi:hypothetical protein